MLKIRQSERLNRV